MKREHYSEADLLETHFINPCISGEVTTHLETCSECAERYVRLEEKLRSAAAEPRIDKPETFWARQKLTILRHAGERQSRHTSAVRTMRIAAAAVFAFFLGGAVVYRAVEPRLEATVEKQTTTTTTSTAPQARTEEVQIVRDPWQSDELKDFHNVVMWESWVENKNGGQS